MNFNFLNFIREKPPNLNERIAISAGNHKNAALMFDRIIPMHSEKLVPKKFRVNMDIPGEVDFLIESINSISNSPYDKVHIRHGSYLFALLQLNEAYHNLFVNCKDYYGFDDEEWIREIAKLTPDGTSHYKLVLEVDKEDYYRIGPMEWLRDIITLITYELSIIMGHKFFPIFNNADVLLNFFKYGGFFVKPKDQRIQIPVVEVVQENILEVIYDSTEWTQIKDIRKDTESLAIVRAYHQIINGESNISDPIQLEYSIDKTIEDFENVVKKHGFQCRLAEKHLFLDAAAATAFGGLSLYSTLLGLPPTVTFTTFFGACISTAKTYFSFREQKMVTHPPVVQIASYLSAVHTKINDKIPRDL